MSSKQIMMGNIPSHIGSKGTVEKYHSESVVMESTPNLTYTENICDSNNEITITEVVLEGDFIAHSFRARSDKRLKENITDITDSLDIINQLNAKKYNFKNSKSKESFGFIAQEMEEILPDLVEKDRNGIRTISYGEIIPILSDAVKTLDRKIQDLEAKTPKRSSSI